MRQLSFSEKEFYHIYNRGVDKRIIFIDHWDFERFLECLVLFNTEKVLGSLRDAPRHSVSGKGDRLVNIVAYCLNPNHFHLILEPVVEKGIERFMHKLSMGYAKYFNTKYKRSGALFQGKFNAKHVENDQYLLHLSAYINLNHMAHVRGHSVSTLAGLSRTSWEEYVKEDFKEPICEKKMVLEQFQSREGYRKFAEESLKSIIERKILLKELEEAGIELVHTA